LKRRQPGDVVLFVDWTMLRLFPPLRAAWSRKGEQAAVPITGQNAKRVLFGAINLDTGHRVVLIRKNAGGADARAFFEELRRRYRRAGRIWLLLDRASAHTAAKTVRLAQELNIELVWLPKQRSELNAMDQVWKELKRLVAANRQAPSIELLAEDAADWVRALSTTEAKRKAGMLSPNFWLKDLLQN
jgi:transposase